MFDGLRQQNQTVCVGVGLLTPSCFQLEKVVKMSPCGNHNSRIKLWKDLYELSFFSCNFC